MPFELLPDANSDRTGCLIPVVHQNPDGRSIFANFPGPRFGAGYTPKPGVSIRRSQIDFVSGRRWTLVRQCYLPSLIEGPLWLPITRGLDG